MVVERPEDADVESDPTELLVVERPVESELIPLCAVLIPLDAEVESEETLLLVVERPVESELIPLDAEVESDPT